MSGTKQKEVCFNCQTNKWCVDFKEGCSAKISRTSICLFCELKQKAEKQEKEIRELKKALEDHDSKVKTLENQIEEMGKEMKNMKKGGNDFRDRNAEYRERRGTKEETYSDIVLERIGRTEEAVRELIGTAAENGSSIVDIRERLAAKEKEKGLNNPASKFTLVRGKKAAKPVTKEKTEINLSNRFALLSREEEETIVLGDSMIRGQGSHFGAGNIKKRKTLSFPGSKINKITNEVKKLELKNRKSTVIVQAGGNNLFLREGKVGDTEPVMKEVEELVEAVSEKTDRAIIVGIIPRIYVSHYALSKAIGINERIKTICKKRGYGFLDPWDTFLGNRQLFNKDGIHFNEAGQRKFGELLKTNLYTEMGKKAGKIAKSVKNNHSSENDSEGISPLEN